MTCLFVADLHLGAERPDKLALFDAFTAAVLRQRVHALYVLGDLFEVWIGDDDDDPEHRRVECALATLSAAGVAVYFMHGNRDFLCGADFAARTGARLLGDFAVLDLDGRRTVVTHGDLLCTRDVKYQRFRRVVRHPVVRRAFLRTPLAWRRRIAHGTRERTLVSASRKSAYIMDVEQAAVSAVLRDHGASLLIHGHTHRPGAHEFSVDGRPCTRIVLGDWYEQDQVLYCRDGVATSLRVEEFLAR
jgi:UDP-2,3-diacylglucosamine hydrolase